MLRASEPDNTLSIFTNYPLPHFRTRKSRFLCERSGSNRFAGDWRARKASAGTGRCEGARLELALELDQMLESLQKILKGGGGEHNRVTPSSHVFGDFQEPAALVL